MERQEAEQPLRRRRDVDDPLVALELEPSEEMQCVPRHRDPPASADGALCDRSRRRDDEFRSPVAPARGRAPTRDNAVMAAEPRMVFLGFGKYARADRIFALEPIRGDERGDGRRTRVWVEGVANPIIASRTERTILHDMGEDAATQAVVVDEALDLAQRLATAAEAGRVDLGDLGRRARHLLDSTTDASLRRRRAPPPAARAPPPRPSRPPPSSRSPATSSALHSSDPATVVLSLRARLDPFAVADLEDALYERRSLLRMLAMRRTMFVVPLDLAAVMDASCTKALVPVERRKLVQMLDEAGVADDVDAWIDRVRAETMAALAGERPAPRQRADQARARPRPAAADRGRQEVRGHGGGVDADAVPHVDRGRHRAHPAARHVAVEPVPVDDGGAVDRRPGRRSSRRPPAPSSSAGGCAAFGPGTTDDIAWWTKWTKAQVKAALAAVGAVEVTADTGDDDKARPPGSWPTTSTTRRSPPPRRTASSRSRSSRRSTRR